MLKGLNGTKEFSVMLQNIQCLRNKLFELEILLSHDLSQVSIICLTEHWLLENETVYLTLPSFSIANIFCRKNHKNGGTAILVRNSIVFENPVNTTHLNDELNFEHSVTQVSLNDTKFLIVCLYRSPNGSLPIFLDKIESLFSVLHKLNLPIISCGDFNLNFLLKTPYVVNLCNLFLTYNLHPVINTATRITSTSHTCLDQFFINPNNFNFSTLNLNSGISDHNSLLLNLHLHSSHPILKSVCLKRSYSKENIDYFNFLLGKEDWEDISNETDTNLIAENFIDTILHYLDVAIPKKRVTSCNNNAYSPDNSWISKGIRKSCKQKRIMHHYYKTTNDIHFKEYYNTYCKILKKVIFQAKNMHNSNVIIQSENINKALWLTVKRETGVHKNRKEPLKILHNNNEINNSLQIANLFNSYFSEVTKKLIKNANNYPLSFPESLLNSKSIFIKPVTENEVSCLIKDLKNKFSHGFDEIPSTVLKYCSKNLIKPITILCNSSLSSGCFPEIFKQAIVKPLFKKGERNNIENYRPISLLSVFSKVLEKSMYNRIVPFLEKCDIFSASQFGFRKGLSINGALYSFLTDILSAKDQKSNVIGLFLDLRKAFDTVNHKILLHKLDKYGIRGHANKWFASYLTNRKQVVKINSYYSNEVTLEHGVPQGSILGPLLFLIFINDLPVSLSPFKTILYADDTNVIFTNKHIMQLKAEISKTNLNLFNWFNHSKLFLNSDKTFFINFSSHTDNDNSLEVSIGNSKISEIDKIKFLGIYINKNLSWDDHISHLKGKLSSLCYAFRILSNISNIGILKTYYFGCIQSVLNYGIIFWGNSPKMIEVFRIQKNILKIMVNVPTRTSSKPIFKKLNIMPLPCLYILETVYFIHCNQQLFKYNHDLHKYSTRISNDLHLNNHRTTKFLNSTAHQGIKLYNKLPNSFKKLDPKKFKRKVSSLLKDFSFYNVNEFFQSSFKDL